jgi:hypothetical protein
MNSNIPVWDIPDNLAELVAENEAWEDESWAPILLTVMGGTSYQGRDIPLSWQIEFEPSDEEFEAANEKIESLGATPDGYGWANVIQSVVAKHHPEMVDELHLGDTDESACVIWVESEPTCKVLIQVAWGLINKA